MIDVDYPLHTLHPWRLRVLSCLEFHGELLLPPRDVPSEDVLGLALLDYTDGVVVYVLPVLDSKVIRILSPDQLAWLLLLFQALMQLERLRLHLCHRVTR